MKKIKILLSDSTSHIENEEYFPLRVMFEPKTDDIRHAGFYYGDEDLLELASAGDSDVLKLMQLTICHHYSILESGYDYNSIDISDENLSLELPDHTECDTFMVSIYDNCIVIKLSSEEPTKFCKSGQLLFGIIDSGCIESIIVTEMTAENIEHTLNELSLQ